MAGITDLRNHVLDGGVEGHCDCMFFVNTYRWDFALNAALLAPRPLLLVNTDRDSIFPLDGVLRVHRQVDRVYELLGARTNLGLVSLFRSEIGGQRLLAWRVPRFHALVLGVAGQFVVVHAG
ncbi:MAG: hypothetical protein ACKO3N_21335, partial [Verrucomicrobiota bacterium]